MLVIRPVALCAALSKLWAAVGGSEVPEKPRAGRYILGDAETARLTGIVDWTYANKYSRELDLGAVTWSWELDHPSLHSSGEIEILRRIDWPKSDAEEVDRLTAFWLANGYWNE